MFALRADPDHVDPAVLGELPDDRGRYGFWLPSDRRPLFAGSATTGSMPMHTAAVSSKPTVLSLAAELAAGRVSSRALIEAAPDRILWGTDWPHPNVKWMPNDGDLMDLFAQMAPEPALQAKILVDNPARLYGF
jgi:hypothetical protein